MQENSSPSSTLVKKWVPIDFGGCLIDYGATKFDTEQECQDFIDGLDYLGHILSPVEVDVNVEPMTDRGLALWDRIREVYEVQQIRMFRMSLTPKFLGMSMDDRIQFTLDMLMIDKNSGQTVDID